MTRLGTFCDLSMRALGLEFNNDIYHAAYAVFGEDKMKYFETAQNLDVVFEGNLDYFVFDQETGEEKACRLYFFNVGSIVRFSVNRIFKGAKAFVNIKVQTRDPESYKYGPWKKNDIFTEPKFIKLIVTMADEYATPIEVTM